MILERHFTWGENKKEERIGWKPDDSPEFDFGQPVHVMHDTMEHLRPGDTSLEGEMKASGATIFVRSAVTLLTHVRRSNVGHSVEGVFNDLMHFVGSDKRPLPAAPSEQKIDDWAEDALQKYAIPYAEAMIPRKGPAIFYSDADLKKRLAAALTWVRVGFNEAKAVYGKLSPVERADLARRIMHAVADNYRDENPVTGDKLAVEVDTEDGTFSMVYEKNQKVTKKQRAEAAMQRTLGDLLGH